MDAESVLNALNLFYDSRHKALIRYDEKCQRAISVELGRPTDHLRAIHNIPLGARQSLSQLLDQLDLYEPHLINRASDDIIRFFLLMTSLPRFQLHRHSMQNIVLVWSNLS